MTTKSSMWVSVCLACLFNMTAVAGSGIAESSPGQESDRITAVTVEQVSSGALVRWVTNRIAVSGTRLNDTKWVEVRGPVGSVRATNITIASPARLLASVPIPREFKGPVTITVGFLDGSVQTLPQTIEVIEPVVGTALVPVDEAGNRIPIDLSRADRLRSELSPQSIQCGGPSLPYVSWVDTASVAPPLPICNGWPKEFRSRQGLLYFFTDMFTGQIIGQNCDVRFKLLPMDSSGYHCHADANRPVGTYDPKAGNTGTSGQEFGVIHEWPRSASFLKGILWSTQAGCPRFNDSTHVGYYYIIAGAVAFGPDVFELTPGAAYTLKQPTPQHPDAYWGLAVMNQALQQVAAAYADSLPGSTLGFNDMGLPYGGTFDLGLNWNPQHCGHQVGSEIDFRCKLLNATQQRVAQFFFEKYNFVPKPELVGTVREHWHVKYYGPGTFRGPGNCLSRP